MHILKLISLTILGLAKQAWRVPQSVTAAIRQRRQHVVREALETERLDRIRNPSKYVGK
jgi:hypothetical protein